MWPFSSSQITQETRVKVPLRVLAELVGGRDQEIADLKDSNARLADALKAAKVRAGDTW